MAALKGSFETSAENPVGRFQLIHTLEKHNDLVRGTKSVVSNHIPQHCLKYRDYRMGHPNWKPSDFDVYIRRADDYTMSRGIASALSQTDTSEPHVAMEFRGIRNAYRAQKFSEPMYKNTGGYEVQWSQQEGINARRYLDMHEWATKAPSRVNTRLGSEHAHYKTYRDRLRASIGGPIDVPMGNLRHPSKTPKKASKKKRKAKPDGGAPAVSRSSKGMMDKMASKVLKSAMEFATNERVRSMLVKAMQNPEDNPLRKATANAAKDAPVDGGVKAMYKCDVITGFEKREGEEGKMDLPVREGTTVFVLEDYRDGFFLCSDDKGVAGTVPSACLHFRESVPYSKFPSAEYTLGKGSPVVACNGISKGDFGATGGRNDYSRALSAPVVKKKSTGRPALELPTLPDADLLVGTNGQP